ncbi:thiol-disulfide oxidoreductase DCC family protein [Sulfitobacter sp.]|uniref:thiol-disulfide oxidoreductase DCC family protein n=1 Tax=Sulfitobacter sp. TaxID=1903071 RepID=UPI003002343B
MSEKLDVLYNASCPICRREVDHYAKLSAQHALPIRYDDLGQGHALADWGISEQDAAKRLHVRKAGQVYSGIPAFILLWREIPQTRRLAKLVSLPGVHWVACKIYDYVLAPLLYLWHLTRQRREN